MAKRKPERSESQKARDRRRIAEMYLRGMLQAEIAETLNISQATVSNDLAELRTEWLQSSLMDFNDRRAQELAKVDDLEREYWTAWKRSQEDAEVKVKEAIKKGDSSAPKKQKQNQAQDAPQQTIVQKIQERTEGQVGDARFLSGIQWCINKRCELLGLDAPKKIAPTNPAGDKPVESVVFYIPNNDRNT